MQRNELKQREAVCIYAYLRTVINLWPFLFYYNSLENKWLFLGTCIMKEIYEINSLQVNFTFST